MVGEERPSTAEEQLDESDDDEGDLGEEDLALTPQPFDVRQERALPAFLDGATRHTLAPVENHHPASLVDERLRSRNNAVRSSSATASTTSNGTVRATTENKSSRILSPRAREQREEYRRSHASQSSENTVESENRRAVPEGWWSSTDSLAPGTTDSSPLAGREPLIR